MSSICSVKSIEHVGEDVLQMIFKLLEVEDLENCEAVCRQWRAILHAGTPWRRLFNRRVIYFFPLLRQALKKLDIEDCKPEKVIGSKPPERGEELNLKMKPSQYRDVCKNVLEVRRNWRTAKFTKWSHGPPENSCACYLEIGDDYVSWNVEIHENDERRKGCFFVDTTAESMKMTELCSVFHFQVLDGTGRPHWLHENRSGLVTVEIHQPGTDCILNLSSQEADGYIYHPTRFTGKQFICYSSCGGGDQGRLRIWTLENSQLILTHDHTRDGCRKLKMLDVDEKFLMASDLLQSNEEPGKTFRFFDPETFEPVRAFSVLANVSCKYQRGLLFEHRVDAGTYRVLDVASGTHFNSAMLSPLRKEGEVAFIKGFICTISFNSSVIVISSVSESRSPDMQSHPFLTHFSVYDLEVVKNGKHDSCCSPLYILQFPLLTTDWEMDETRLAVMGTYGPDFTYLGNRLVIVLNFSSSPPLAMLTKKETPVEASASDSTSDGGRAVYVQETANVEMTVFKDLSVCG